FTETRSLVVTVQCPSPWFFAPPPPGCPQSSQTSAIIFQPFERGVAFYVANNNTIYFLANENSRVNAYSNQWTTNIIIPPAVPPAGLIDPRDQIGYAWRQNNWSDGRQMIQVMGWATGQQQNYSGTIQIGSPGNDVYLQRPDGAIYK